MWFFTLLYLSSGVHSSCKLSTSSLLCLRCPKCITEMCSSSPTLQKWVRITEVHPEVNVVVSTEPWKPSGCGPCSQRAACIVCFLQALVAGGQRSYIMPLVTTNNCVRYPLSLELKFISLVSMKIDFSSKKYFSVLIKKLSHRSMLVMLKQDNQNLYAPDICSMNL